MQLETIEVCYKPVIKQIGFHKYFVYTRADRTQLALRAGPDPAVPQPAKDQAIELLERGENPFANLRCITGAYDAQWLDYPQSGERRASEVLVYGPDLSSIWGKLVEAMAMVNREDYQYHPTLQSSNTLMDHVLRQLGLPPTRRGAWNDFWAPGSGLPMQAPGRVEGTPISHTVPEALIRIFKINIALTPKEATAL